MPSHTPSSGYATSREMLHLQFSRIFTNLFYMNEMQVVEIIDQ